MSYLNTSVPVVSLVLIALPSGTCGTAVLRIFVSLKQLSSTCHVSFFAAPDTDHKHKFSLTNLTCLPVVLSLMESNYSGRLSYVSSQPAMIPRSLSLLSRDKWLPLDTWNALGLQENVFGNQFSILAHHKENEGQFHKRQGRGRFSQEMTSKIETQFQCRHLREGLRPFVRQYRWIRDAFLDTFPNFEMLDAKIASVLNKIIMTSQFN